MILDVVYNHTAEGNHMGPTLSFRGIDNANYYRLVDDDQAHYFDTTGTGNSLLMRSPHVLQLIMDSLRYWVTEMHVDGFRFDLAATLARQFHEVDRLSAFFDLVHQDPVVSQVKLIAEPWDVGDGGYQVGGFPPLWSEWNGKYRDTVRDFWRGEPSTLGEFASRLSGSSDLYEHTGRRPIASVNFVTAHDGFTLSDLVSYNEKHNEANGEGNHDGESHNRSWNCGVEGPTDDPAILALRARQQRNFLTTLLLSQGVPDDRARRRARPHPAGQQQRLLPGQPDRPGSTGTSTRTRTRSSSSRGASSACAGSTPCSVVAASSPVRPSTAESRTCSTSRGSSPDRRAHVRRGVGRRRRAPSRSSSTATPSPSRTCAARRSSTTRFLILFNGQPDPATFTMPEVDYGEVWTAVLDTDSQIEAGSTVAGRGGDDARPPSRSSCSPARPRRVGLPPRASAAVATSRRARRRAGEEALGRRATTTEAAAEAHARLGRARPHERARPTPARRLPTAGQPVPVSHLPRAAGRRPHASTTSRRGCRTSRRSG